MADAFDNSVDRGRPDEGIELAVARNVDSARFAMMPQPSFAQLGSNNSTSDNNMLSVISNRNNSRSAGPNFGTSADGHPIISIAVPDDHGGFHPSPGSPAGKNNNSHLEIFSNNGSVSHPVHQLPQHRKIRAETTDDEVEMRNVRSTNDASGLLRVDAGPSIGSNSNNANLLSMNSHSGLEFSTNLIGGTTNKATGGAQSSGGSGNKKGAVVDPTEDIHPSQFEVTPLSGIIRDKQEEYAHRNLSLWEGASWRSRVYSIVEPFSFESDVPISIEWGALVYSLVTTGLVLLSCIAVMGTSYSDYVMSGFPASWVVISTVCVAFFTIDTVLRFVTTPNRFTFFFDVIILCDILAIIPFYISLFGDFNIFFWWRMLRIVRIIKLVKIFKGSSSSVGLRSFILALQHSVEGMFVFVAIAVTSMFILATCTYFAERGDFNGTTWYRKCLAYEECSGPNNTEPSPFQSISDAFWYTIVTMCTVGLSDQYPKSGVGQFVGGCTMLMGIFLMALPTMILSGNYDASKELSGRSMNISWRYIYDQNVQRLSAPPVPMKEQLMQRKGWSYRDERQRMMDALVGKTRASLTPRVSLAAAAGGRNSLLGSSPMSPARRTTIMGGNANKRSSLAIAAKQQQQRRRSSVAVGLNGKDATAIAEAFEEFANNHVDLIDEKPIAVFKIPNTTPSKLGYLRRTKDPRRFLYDPIMTLVLTEDGRPRATAILGTDGMPSTVRFDILIDTPECQAQAEAAAKFLHPGATAEVDNGGGWRVRHHSALSTLKSFVLPSQPSARYQMLPTIPRAGFRDPRGSGVGVSASIGGDASVAATAGGIYGNSTTIMNRSLAASTSVRSSAVVGATTLPVYFMRIPYNDDINRELTHEARYLKPQQVIDECMNTILGSSLVVTKLLSTGAVRRRVPVVLQMLENSRFHYEMQMIASKSATDEDVGKERTAFVTESDAIRLLRGIHHKVDLYDASLELEDPNVVDYLVAMTILNRLRRSLIATIAPKLRRSIYNEEVLSSSDTVIEVPLSLFSADEDDTVEEDALGYVEVSARSCAGSSVRIDFAVETTEQPTPSMAASYRASPVNARDHAAAARKKKAGLAGATPLNVNNLGGNDGANNAAGGGLKSPTDGNAGLRSPISWSAANGGPSPRSVSRGDRSPAVNFIDAPAPIVGDASPPVVEEEAFPLPEVARPSTAPPANAPAPADGGRLGAPNASDATNSEQAAPTVAAVAPAAPARPSTAPSAKDTAAAAAKPPTTTTAAAPPASAEAPPPAQEQAVDAEAEATPPPLTAESESATAAPPTAPPPAAALPAADDEKPAAAQPEPSEEEEAAQAEEPQEAKDQEQQQQQQSESEAPALPQQSLAEPPAAEEHQRDQERQQQAQPAAEEEEEQPPRVEAAAGPPPPAEGAEEEPSSMAAAGLAIDVIAGALGRPQSAAVPPAATTDDAEEKEVVAEEVAPSDEAKEEGEKVIFEVGPPAAAAFNGKVDEGGNTAEEPPAEEETFQVAANDYDGADADAPPHEGKEEENFEVTE